MFGTFILFLYSGVAFMFLFVCLGLAIMSDYRAEFKRATRGIYLAPIRPVWIARKLYDKSKNFYY